MRKTKIVCTIGPACDNEDTLTQMCLSGMNVARLNFSHGSHEEQLHKHRPDQVACAKQLKHAHRHHARHQRPGIPHRAVSRNGRDLAQTRASVSRSPRADVLGDRESIVSVSYKNLPHGQSAARRHACWSTTGLMVFRVLEVDRYRRPLCEVVAGGELTDRKSMSFPGKVLKQAYLSEQDKEDIRFGVENDVDFIACSFVSRREDLDDVHALARRARARGYIDLIAKIENQLRRRQHRTRSANACDGIMIGRGDMGVEIPFEELPPIQKASDHQVPHAGQARHHRHGNARKSMIHNARPTRAEISDVANAVYDGTSAIMLSGETAAGEHPVLARRNHGAASPSMHRARASTTPSRFLQHANFRIQNIVDAISHATCGMAIDIARQGDRRLLAFGHHGAHGLPLPLARWTSWA